ncbi:MAG: hypothetical protein IJ446_04110 [Oscillospiraceae bacterium]|nr:hypothetical protein [Oscillospiraceae bacterium]
MSEIFSDIFTVGVPVCIITALVCTISLAISNVRSIQPYNAAKHNLLIKLLHIPAYIFYINSIADNISVSETDENAHIRAGLLFMVCLLTGLISGIHSASSAASAGKKGVITKSDAVLTGICSFVPCLDVILSIILFIKCKKTRTALQPVPTAA